MTYNDCMARGEYRKIGFTVWRETMYSDTLPNCYCIMFSTDDDRRKFHGYLQGTFEKCARDFIRDMKQSFWSHKSEEELKTLGTHFLNELKKHPHPGVRTRENLGNLGIEITDEDQAAFGPWLGLLIDGNKKELVDYDDARRKDTGKTNISFLSEAISEARRATDRGFLVPDRDYGGYMTVYR